MRVLSLLQKLPIGRILPWHVAVVLFMGLLGFLGFRSGHAPPPEPAQGLPGGAPPVDSAGAAAFQQMRPRWGDRMAPPRLGFRWVFDGSRVPAPPAPSPNRASMVPSFLRGADSVAAVARARDKVRFLLHLVGPGGAPELHQETPESQIVLDLRNTLPAGEYEWWVDALLPGAPPVSSPRERFALTP